MDDAKALLKWLDYAELQKVQNSFSELTGMSAVVTDNEGNPLTEKSGSSSYCDLLVQSSGQACRLCNACRCFGSKEARKTGHGTFYYCHMGLVEFSSPIVVNDTIVAVFVGGMVFERPPVQEDIHKYAVAFGIDPGALWNAARKIPVFEIEKIEKAAAFLYDIANVCAGTAESRIRMDNAGKELEKVSQMKSDFLANMSHEIRTPMNAVIGMADVALSEEMSPEAQEYVRQIQSSGKSLLHIINDILDYSKITSGKLDIFEEDYDPRVMIRDITSIVLSRLKDKENDVILLMDIDSNIPSALFGDSSRIRQVLINLANNAVKFTNKGFVKIFIGGKKLDSETFLLSLKVADTGIGIKKGDLDKLFQSFTQVDSKRNRNVEGTGLGLAIVKSIVETMNGNISVESKYEVGSTFTVELPQKISDPAPLTKIDAPEKIAACGFFTNADRAENFANNCDHLGISEDAFIEFDEAPGRFDNWLLVRANYTKFVFLESKIADEVLARISLNSEKCAHVYPVIVGSSDDENLEAYKNKNFKIARFPLQSLNLSPLFTHSEAVSEEKKDEDGQERFSASSAVVLVVDDNKVNLRVAEKMLSMYGITPHKAMSGVEALDMIIKTNYDLIFMDHMMPGLDGIDTTRLIRRFHPKFNSIPIIALTANVVEESRKMFLDEGMNDFIGKPIDIKVLGEKLKKWLPPSKIENTANEK